MGESSTSARAIISKAKRLIAESQASAQDLILKAGYYQGIKPVQAEYYALFPPTPLLQQHWEGPLKQLKDGDAGIRLKAARWIAGQGCQEPSIARAAWMKDPHTVELLLEATNDPDTRVVENAAIAIKMICTRYYRDLRANPIMVGLLTSPSANVRYVAAEAVGILEGDGFLDHLLPMLNDRSAKVRQGVCRILTFPPPKRLSQRDKQRLTSSLLKVLEDKLWGSRDQAAAALRYVGDASIIPQLQVILKKERHRAVRESLTRAIQDIQKRGEPSK